MERRTREECLHRFYIDIQWRIRVIKRAILEDKSFKHLISEEYWNIYHKENKNAPI